MKPKIKVQFMAGAYENSFMLIPCLQIVYRYSHDRQYDFVIEAGWGKWGGGVKFFKRNS